MRFQKQCVSLRVHTTITINPELLEKCMTKEGAISSVNIVIYGLFKVKYVRDFCVWQFIGMYS